MHWIKDHFPLEEGCFFHTWPHNVRPNPNPNPNLDQPKSPTATNLTSEIDRFATDFTRTDFTGEISGQAIDFTVTLDILWVLPQRSLDESLGSDEILLSLSTGASISRRPWVLNQENYNAVVPCYFFSTNCTCRCWRIVWFVRLWPPGRPELYPKAWERMLFFKWNVPFFDSMNVWMF